MAEWLQQQGATFVTLMQDDRLRGRHGSLDAMRPLHEDVVTNAVAAAFRDPRFAPLRKDDLQAITIEIAVLSALESLHASDESIALKQLRPGQDGVVLRYGRHRSTFLPESWSQYADPADFLAQLKYKAGLPPDFWDAGIELQRYTVTGWRENK